MVRRVYVQVMQGAGKLLRATGVDRFMAKRQNFWARHIWSLFAVYDADRMIMFGKPWWVYRAADQVEEFLASKDGKARVFEYGAGASTVWLAPRAGEIHSVEHDGAFLDVMRPKLADYDHVTLHDVAPGKRTPGSTAISGRPGHEDLDFAEYADTIKQVGGQFDLIIVDGRARVACLEIAKEHLAPDGLLLFDDAGRQRYTAGLQTCGLEVNILKGLAPSSPFPDTTALLTHAQK